MFNKKSLALLIAGAFMGTHAIPAQAMQDNNFDNGFIKDGKGQLRAAKSKPSGAASLKRTAKKLNNIRKHSK